jgi:serine/threonine-protein kinase
MGYVYEVERLSDKKHLALKMAAGISAVSLARFAREAKLFATLDHPRIVGIIDVDVAASGFLYLVMEYIEGESLRHQESRYGDIPWALHILHQVAEGLAELHRVGIVHRDLKPANILLSKGGDEGQPNIKITDFGVSRLSSPPDLASKGGEDEGSSARATTVPERVRASMAPRAQDELATVEIQTRDSNEIDAMAVTGALEERSAESPNNSLIVTRVGEVTGTPHYIAPEAAKGEGKVAPISDMFSLGVLGFEIVVGKRPFSFPAVLAAVAGHEPEEADDLLEACPHLPAEIAALIQSCLQLSPKGRPSAQAFADSLHRLLQVHFAS